MSANLPYCFAQDDPAAICADRPLRTREIHKQNDFYGQAAVLKRYAGLPQSYRLKGVLEHGIVLDYLLCSQERDALLPMIFSSSARRAAIQRRHTSKRAVPIGFGYLYAMRLMEAQFPAIAEADRRGTLVFPCHSTHTIRASFDHDDYARRLAALPERFQPAVVCLYWKNFLAGEAEAYVRRGLAVVSAGHIYDPDFLLRSHDVARRFRYACANKIGTHLFQTVASGCRFFFLPSGDITWDVPAHEQPNIGRDKPGFAEAEAEAELLFAEPVDEITAAQRDFVDRLLGTADMKTAAELRNIFLAAELRDKLWPLGRQGEQDRTDVTPPFLSRPLARLRRWLGKRFPPGQRPKAA